VAAPDFVPVDPTQRVRSYHSPPRRADSWSATRPGDLPLGQPEGRGIGSQGPDQGYVYKLVPVFEGQIVAGDLDHEDVLAGCVDVALKRAAHYGRAPVVHDLRVALTIFGFLDPEAPADLVGHREDWFEGLAHGHHYAERRALVDRVPIESLATGPEVALATYRRDWKANLVV
jgi:hypothetical protein